jgi:hypothetical protein
MGAYWWRKLGERSEILRARRLHACDQIRNDPQIKKREGVAARLWHDPTSSITIAVNDHWSDCKRR